MMAMTPAITLKETFGQFLKEREAAKGVKIKKASAKSECMVYFPSVLKGDQQVLHISKIFQKGCKAGG